MIYDGGQKTLPSLQSKAWTHRKIFSQKLLNLIIMPVRFFLIIKKWRFQWLVVMNSRFNGIAVNHRRLIVDRKMDLLTLEDVNWSHRFDRLIAINNNFLLIDFLLIAIVIDYNIQKKLIFKFKKGLPFSFFVLECSFSQSGDDIENESMCGIHCWFYRYRNQCTLQLQWIRQTAMFNLQLSF